MCVNHGNNSKEVRHANDERAGALLLSNHDRGQSFPTNGSFHCNAIVAQWSGSIIFSFCTISEKFTDALTGLRKNTGNNAHPWAAYLSGPQTPFCLIQVLRCISRKNECLSFVVPGL